MRTGFAIRLFVRAFVLLLVMGPVGCATNGAGNGTGGTAGAAGTGGTAGTGGSPIVFCEPTNERCESGTIEPYEPCCEQPVPDQANACDGTESLENPTTCTATGETVTHRLTVMEVEEDCNVGYDLDDCEGQTCRQSLLAPADGVSGVDNGLGGLVPLLAATGSNLNKRFSHALCGLTDSSEAGTCVGGDNDRNACTRDDDCSGAGSWCDRSDDDCLREIVPTEIRFVVDANASEDCVNVTVLADGEASAHILNLSDDGCASGTLGTIPLTIFGVPGSLANTVVRMTVSPAGFSHGLLGAVTDNVGFEAEASLFDINASTPPIQNTSEWCNAFSATLLIGGVAD